MHPSKDATIKLKSFYLEKVTDTKNLVYQIITVPSSGQLYQLSQVFSTYGYEPKAGVLIQGNKISNVTGSSTRVYYVRHVPDAITDKMVHHTTP